MGFDVWDQRMRSQNERSNMSKKIKKSKKRLIKAHREFSRSFFNLMVERGYLIDEWHTVNKDGIRTTKIVASRRIGDDEG